MFNRYLWLRGPVFCWKQPMFLLFVLQVPVKHFSFSTLFPTLHMAENRICPATATASAVLQTSVVCCSAVTKAQRLFNYHPLINHIVLKASSEHSRSIKQRKHEGEPMLHTGSPIFKSSSSQNHTVL